MDLDSAQAVEWLNLCCYDHHDQQPLPQGKENEEIWVRCLIKIEGVTQCIRGTIIGYDSTRNKYKFKYTINGKAKGCFVPRIYLCSDLEDPHRYCDKVAKAFFGRLYADNLIKQSYYVERMPTEGLSSLDQTQRERITLLTGQSNYDQNSLEILMDEAQTEYWKTMNTIILNKHLDKSQNQLVPTHLSVSLARVPQPAPYNGLINTGRQNTLTIEGGEKTLTPSTPFVNVFGQFCETTILNEKCVVTALRQVKLECERLTETELSKTVRERKDPARFEQFQTEQMSFLQRSVNKLRNTWITSIRDIAEQSLRKGQGNWLTMNPEPASYHTSKLRRYFRVIKLLMEDAIRETAHNSFGRLFNFVTGYIPEKVEVESIYIVRNYFADGSVVSS